MFSSLCSDGPHQTGRLWFSPTGLSSPWWQHFRSLVFLDGCPPGKYLQFSHLRHFSHSTKTQLRGKWQQERPNCQLLAPGTAGSLWFSLSSFPAFLEGLPAAPPWVCIFCSLLSLPSLPFLSSGRSAKLVPRELFWMKLKISTSLCLLLEMWSLPWLKGQ